MVLHSIVIYEQAKNNIKVYYLTVFCRTFAKNCIQRLLGIK